MENISNNQMSANEFIRMQASKFRKLRGRTEYKLGVFVFTSLVALKAFFIGVNMVASLWNEMAESYWFIAKTTPPVVFKYALCLISLKLIFSNIPRAFQANFDKRSTLALCSISAMTTFAYLINNLFLK